MEDYADSSVTYSRVLPLLRLFSQGSEKSDKLWLLLSRFILQVNSISATLCDICVVSFNAINDARSL